MNKPMDILKRAQQLLNQPESARVMQVAAVIKQAVAADEVAVFTPSKVQPEALSTVWSEGSLSEVGSEPYTHPVAQASVLPIGFLGALTAEPDELALCVHYFQGGFWWEPRDMQLDRVQVMCLRLQYASKPYIFMWARSPDRPFTESDRLAFEDLSHVALASFKHFRVAGEGNGSANSARNSLSPMEKKVFALLKTGLTEKNIAKQLQRSPNTIHVHVRNIYRKHLVNSRAELLDLTGSPAKQGPKWNLSS